MAVKKFKAGKQGSHINGRLMGEILEVKEKTLLVKWKGFWPFPDSVSEIKKELFNQW
jgi:hypothetical protein